MPKFNEDNTTEQMLLTTLQRNGWEYIPAEELDRDESDVMVESMVRAALIRLNPEIAEDESRADEVIYKLRTLFLSTNAQAREAFFGWLSESGHPERSLQGTGFREELLPLR